MEPAHDFGDQVNTVLQFQTRRWRYWDTLFENTRFMPDAEVARQVGWTRKGIENERDLALHDLLV